MRLHDVVADAARATPDAAALVTDEGTLTFADLAARVDTLAGLVAGITRRGDRVAVLAENRAECVDCYYAVPAAGRVLVPLHQRLHPEEWRRALARAGATVLVAEPDLLERLGPDPRRDTAVEVVVELDDLDAPRAAGDDVPAVAGARATPGGPDPAAAPVPPPPDDVAWFVGTSGTTGTPKLAMLTHRSLLTAVDATLGARPVTDDDVLLTPFPLAHVAGYNVIAYHRRRRPVVLMRRFDPVHLAELVRTHRVSALSLAPTMIGMLLDAARAGDVDDDDLRTVRALGYGASPMPAPILRAAVERWDWDLSQGYGMTELSGNAVFLGPDDHRAAAAGDETLLRAAGRPAPGVELTLAPGTDEVLVRAPQVFAGYWGDGTASATALADGWLHTGDVGRIGDDGLLTLVDRLKDVIVSGGENVASLEVEAALARHPAVGDVAVVGVPDPRWGERVTAVVVPRAGVTVTGDELVAFCRSRLARFKTPKAVVLVDELPRNATGKVLKAQLREELGRGTG